MGKTTIIIQKSRTFHDPLLAKKWHKAILSIQHTQIRVSEKGLERIDDWTYYDKKFMVRIKYISEK